MDLVAGGRSSKDVATALYLSPRTVEGHLVRIYRKIGVRTRVELIAKYAGGSIPSDSARDLSR
jgi:DNA-binding CsgD family transcriptional regulator